MLPYSSKCLKHLVTLARSNKAFRASESCTRSSFTSASSERKARPSAAHFFKSTSLSGLHKNLQQYNQLSRTAKT